MDALRPGVPDALTRLATRAGCSVVTTYRAKGLIDEDDPHALGAAGLSPLADEALLAFARRADLVLLVGYDPVEMRSNWTRPFGPDQEVHALGPNRRDRISGRHHASPDLAADLGRLADLVSRPADPGAEAERVALREELARRFAPRRAWEPAALLAEAAAITRRRGAVTTVDTGAHRILLAQQWRLPAPDLLLQSTGFCTMACALPLAIGARLAAPERPVLAVVGDGGLEMGLGELATLRDLGGPLVVVVLDDSSYALIDMKQRSRGLPAAGVHLGATDFAAVARAFGGRARRIEERETFREALEEGFDAPVFTLLHAPFPRGAYDGRI
ncbi:MAG: thiamine pyrophosphate-dependent enzyme [Planctomycetota bacterium]